MGTKMAPTYANISMGRLEKQFLQSVSIKPFAWLRFIATMQLIHDKETLEAFFERATKQLSPNYVYCRGHY